MQNYYGAIKKEVWRKQGSKKDFITNSNINSSTYEADNTTYEVSAAHTQSNPTSGDNLSDAVIYEMDLQWEMSMLTIRAWRFIKRIGRKLDVNGQRVRFDRSKVECYNCHKNCHFVKECRAPRNQENRGRENSRRTVTVETPTDNTLVAQDRIGGKKIIDLQSLRLDSDEIVRATYSRRSTRKKELSKVGALGTLYWITKCFLTVIKIMIGGFVFFGDGKGRIIEKLPDEVQVFMAESSQEGYTFTVVDLRVLFPLKFNLPLLDHIGKFDEKSDEGFLLGNLCTPISAAGPSFTNDDPSSP
ncbi:ribonuclease H-like domain-containing protein [Tanacetum coccineum]